MQKEDLYLYKTIKGAAAYYHHTPEDQARKIGISSATWYRRLHEPGTFTLREIRKLIRVYNISTQEVCDFLGMKR